MAAEKGKIAETMGEGATNTLSFSPKLAGIKVTPNGDEGSDANFPRNLHNAGEVFLRSGNVQSARALHECTERVLGVLEGGPDGKSGCVMGRAVVCWECGYAGLPVNAGACHAVETVPAGVCKGCKEDGQTNFLMILGEGGREVPWMEGTGTVGVKEGI